MTGSWGKIILRQWPRFIFWSKYIEDQIEENKLGGNRNSYAVINL